MDFLNKIGNVKSVIPAKMITHILVAGELIMGAINGTVHVVRDNIQFIKDQEKRKNYLARLNKLHDESRERYRDVMEMLQ